MNRLFSVTRRRPNLVDIRTPRESVPGGQRGYRFEWAPNFTGAWTAITPDVTRAMSGYLDPAVDQRTLAIQNSDQIRVVIDPATYTIPDTKAFWLRLQPLDAAGAPLGDPGAATLVLPDSAINTQSIITIAGTAPSGADVADSIQIDLPRLGSEFVFVNQEAATDLFVATEFEGAEMLVAAATSLQPSYDAVQSSFWIRGGGATADFSLTFTLAFPR